MKTIIKTKRSHFLSLTAPPDLGAEADLVVYSWGDQLLAHIQVMTGEHEREFCATQIQGVNAHSQSSLSDISICKESNRMLNGLYISLCDYLSRDKSVQSHHLSWLALAAVAIGAHGVGFVLIWCWWQAVKWFTSQVCHHTRHSCFCLRWYPSGWSRPEITEAHSIKCSLPPTPGKVDSDLSCLDKKLKCWSCEVPLPNVSKVSGSPVTFGQLWDLWEWSRREAEEAGIGQSPALRPVSYSWIAGAAPCPRLLRLDQLLG